MVTKKIVADGMLGSLARKLRIFGFDVLYDVKKQDEEILGISREEERLIITSDRNLHNRAILKRLDSILISEDTDEERAASIFRTLNLKPRLNPKDSRCPLCNGEIKETHRDQLSAEIPKEVSMKYNKFYICSKCGKVYWIGSHWFKLKRFSARVTEKLR